MLAPALKVEFKSSSLNLTLDNWLLVISGRKGFLLSLTLK